MKAEHRPPTDPEPVPNNPFIACRLAAADRPANRKKHPPYSRKGKDRSGTTREEGDFREYYRLR